jgi:hypothetical protein
MNALYWILWPAFLVATVATGFLVNAVNPQEVQLAGHHLALSNLGAYTIGFFTFWSLGAASSLTTCVLRRSSAEINRRACP